MVELTLDNFQSEVIAQQGIVAIDAYADYCPGCLSAKNIIEELSPRYPQIRWTKLNTSKQKEITQAFNIQSVPYILFFQDGHFINGTYATDRSSLNDEISKLINR